MPTLRTFASTLALALLLIAAPHRPAEAAPNQAPADATPAFDDSRLVDRPDEIITRLDSGLTVIVKRYPAAPVASVRMHVKAGSIWEDDYAGAGISHLFEHLLHGATTNRRSEADSRKIIEQIGATTNAATSNDQTYYFLDVPREHVNTAIDLLADWVTRPIFPQEEVDRELGVVQRELERGAQEPQRQLYYAMMAQRYQVHPARFPVIGQKAALARLTRDDIIAYHKRMYVPSRVVVAVVGDVDPPAVLAEIKKQFADFAARTDRPIVLPEEPAVTSPRTLVRQSSGTQVRFAVGYPSVDLMDPDLYPLDVAMYILGGGQSSRLQRELRDRQRLALDIDASNYTPEWADGTFYVTGLCLPQNWPALREAILAQYDRLAGEPVSAEELARAKRQVIVQHIRYQQTASAIGASLASSQLGLGDAHFDDQYVRRIQDVTAEQVQAAARKYFDRGRLLTTLLVPQGFSPADEAEAQQARQAQVSDVRKVVLKNGLTVLLRRNSAVPLVSVQMHFNGGLLAEPADQNGVCQLMVQSALRGTASHTGDEVFEAFEAAGGAIGGNSGRNSFSFSASVLAEDFPRLMPLFAEVVSQPAFPPDQVAPLKARTLAAIARIDDQLESTASRFFFARFFGDHPYGRPVIGSADTVAKLSPEALSAFHKQVVTAPNAVLAVFGDIELDQAERQVRELFDTGGRFALSDKKTAIALPAAPKCPSQPGRLFNKTKLSQAAEVDMGFAGVAFTDDDYYPLMLLDTMISGYRMPGGWLHETLRGRQLVYMVHAMNIAWKQAGVFYIIAHCPPDKVAETTAAIHEQLDRARNGELTEEMLTNAKGQVIAGELMDLQTNDQLASQCALDELLGRGYDHYTRLSERVGAVTLAEVNRVAKKYLVNPMTAATTCTPPADKPGDTD